MKHITIRSLALLLALVMCLACSLVACDDGGKDTPTEAPTDAPTEAPTSAPTEAPTEALTAAPTEAATTAPEAPTATGAVTDKAEKSGCGSVLGSSAVLLLIAASAFTFAKKKHV